MSNPEKASRRKISFLAIVKAVLWRFFGVRKKKDYESDKAGLNPVHVVITSVIGEAIFIVKLITIVKLVVAK